MTARDVRTRDSKTKWCHNEALDAKSTLFMPIIVPRQSETSLHNVQEESAAVSRSMAAILFETNGHVTRASCDVPHAVAKR